MISYGPTVHTIIEAAELLTKEDISATVLNARFIKPMDIKKLHEVGRSNQPVLIAEEGMLNGGLGSQIATFFMEHGYTNL
ncbi:transketolase C-terminal domain-containing protein, partial [Staphylococcus aureus]